MCKKIILPSRIRTQFPSGHKQCSAIPIFPLLSLFSCFPPNQALRCPPSASFLLSTLNLRIKTELVMVGAGAAVWFLDISRCIHSIFVSCSFFMLRFRSFLGQCIYDCLCFPMSFLPLFVLFYFFHTTH